MLCSKFEPTPSSNFQVTAILNKIINSKHTVYMYMYLVSHTMSKLFITFAAIEAGSFLKSNVPPAFGSDFKSKIPIFLGGVASSLTPSPSFEAVGGERNLTKEMPYFSFYETKI